jgi:hypothetical protein
MEHPVVQRILTRENREKMNQVFTELEAFLPLPITFTVDPSDRSPRKAYFTIWYNGIKLFHVETEIANEEADSFDRSF